MGRLSKVDFNPLEFDYELVHAQRVISIKGCGVVTNKLGTRVDKVAVCLDRMTIFITTDENTDQIVLEVLKNERANFGSARKWKNLSRLSKYLGMELGWCWLARNCKNYADLFILSFSGVEPQVVFCGIASTLWVYEMRRMRRL